jgi:hypothetical protein
MAIAIVVGTNWQSQQKIKDVVGTSQQFPENNCVYYP